jgi:hypothetical protein
MTRVVLFALVVLTATMVAPAHAQSASAAESCQAFNDCGSNSSSTATSRAQAAAAARQAALATQAAAIQNNLQNEDQNLNNAANALINVVNRSNSANDSSATSSNSNSSNDDDDDSSDTPATPTPNPAPALSPSPTATDGSTGSAPSTAAAVNNLLGNVAAPSQQPTAQAPTAADQAATANSVSNLLSNPNAASNSAPISPAPQVPDDSEFSIVFNESAETSADQSTPSTSAALAQALLSGGQQIKDSLNGLVSAGQGLVSNVTNSPAAQWAMSQGWEGTTAPLPVATDSPETMANLTQGQAIVGFGDILNGMAAGPWGMAKGLYSYGTKMVNQMGADLGFASANIQQGSQGGQD